METPRLFLVRLHARPQPRSKFAKQYGGAYVNCFVNFALPRGAEVVAKDCVTQNGWVVTRKIVIKSVTKKDSKGDKLFERYFNEATRLGVSTAFFCYLNREQKKSEK